MKDLPCRIFALLLLTPFSASAILLDCKDHGDGTYTCVEISESATTEHIEAAFVEQAKEQCKQRTIKRHATGGMSSRGAVRMEAMKGAKEDYDRCVANKARELRDAGQQSE